MIKATAEVTVTDRTDATAIRAWYHAQTSAVAPSAPTTTSASATPSGWTLAEPTISGAADLSKYVYRCEQLVWGDGTCDWGTVTLSSSYEAAKVAYNEAQTARTTATRYITDITDGIFVAPDGQGPKDTATPTGWRIRDALELIKSGISAFRVWLESGVAKVRIGESDGNHVTIDDDSIDMSHSGVEMAHFGYGEGAASGGTGTAPYYTLGRRADTTTNVYSSSSTYSVGARVLYDNEEYICIRAITTPEAWTANRWQRSIGNWSVAVGNRVTASGYSSYAEGNGATAIGGSSHAEGNYTFVSGIGSHAEGSVTTVSGNYSHAEGYRTTVSGDYSHAEGSHTTASGNRSHAQNYGTVAAYSNQTAIGKYNDNQSTNAFEIGNGTDGNPSNAFAVDWDGIPYARNPNNDFGSIFDLVYPVGAIYMSTVSTSPATLFGGTWERITGRFLLAATDGGAAGGNSNASIAAGNTGGEATHTLTPTETATKNHAHTMDHGHGFTQPTITVKRSQAAASGSATYVPASNGSNSVTNVASASGGKVANHSGSTGGQTAANGSAHNNMPPYLAVYMWKRTA